MDAGLVIRALLKYVDDVNVVCAILRRGTRWVDSAMRWSREWEQQDEESGVPDGLRTISLIKEVADDDHLLGSASPAILQTSMTVARGLC